MFVLGNIERIKNRFLWFRFIGGGWRPRSAGVIIEKLDHGTDISLYPPILQLKNYQTALGLSDDEIESFTNTLITYTIHLSDTKKRSMLIDEPLRAIMRQYGLSRTLSESEWNDFVKMLFFDVKIQKWKESYINSHILDGYQWSLEYRLGNSTRRIGGSNDYPDSWKQFITHLRSLASFSDIPI